MAGTAVASAAEVFTAYLEAFSGGDFDKAYGMLSEDFVFDGPVLHSRGRAEFIEGTKELQPAVNGYRMIKQFADGREVCSIYEFGLNTPKGPGTVLMMEWSKLSRGKLASSRLVFDTAEFAALLGG